MQFAGLMKFAQGDKKRSGNLAMHTASATVGCPSVRFSSGNLFCWCEFVKTARSLAKTSTQSRQYHQNSWRNSHVQDKKVVVRYRAAPGSRCFSERKICSS